MILTTERTFAGPGYGMMSESKNSGVTALPLGELAARALLAEKCTFFTRGHSRRDEAYWLSAVCWTSLRSHR